MTVQVPEIKINENVNLNSKESAIIVVDMQNDFCDPKGSLYVPESRKTIEPIMKLLEKAREKNVKIFLYPGYSSKRRQRI